MRELPIAFSTDLIPPVMKGLKDLTRRLLNPQPVKVKKNQFVWEPKPNVKVTFNYPFDKEYKLLEMNLPFKKGDILWVREEHNLKYFNDGTYSSWICLYKDGFSKSIREFEIPKKTLENIKKRRTIGQWQRGRFLPKVFSRIRLTVTKVRIERLQDISEQDAKREGVIGGFPCLEFGTMFFFKTPFLFQKDSSFRYKNYTNLSKSCKAAKNSFQTLWEKLHGPESWKENPFVLVVEFKLLK